MAERGSGEPVDRWLRRGLGGDAAAETRITAAALASSESPSGASARSTLRRVAVAAALIAVALAGWRLATRSTIPATMPAEAIRIANYGDLVAVFDPAGAVRLRTSQSEFSPGAPRLIIQIGDTHAP